MKIPMHTAGAAVTASAGAAALSGHSQSVPATAQVLAISPRLAQGPGVRLFVIQGITQDGRNFRPSDWAERLAGALSSFQPGGAPARIGSHIRYSPYCVPRVVDGHKCVIVSEALRGLEPMAWDFVMHFARDNGLKVVEIMPEAAPPR